MIGRRSLQLFELQANQNYFNHSLGMAAIIKGAPRVSISISFSQPQVATVHRNKPPSRCSPREVACFPFTSHFKQPADVESELPEVKVIDLVLKNPPRLRVVDCLSPKQSASREPLLLPLTV